MGEMIHVRCRACKKEWQCFTGNGLLHGKKENILAAFLQKEQPFVNGLLASSEIPAYDFRYRLAVCGHCRNVVAVPALGETDDVESYIGLCPLCGKRTKNICPEEESAEQWSEKTACPVCKSRKLEAEEAGHWD